ncbi:MAG: type II secretion system ATPase GspE [Thermodesulfobacteriota bacterium]
MITGYEDKPIGRILLTQGLIDKEMLERGMKEQANTGERLASTLVRLGFLSEKDMLKALSVQLEIPYLSPDSYPKEAIPIIPPLSVKFMKHYAVIPIGKNGVTIKIATANPLDTFPIEALKTATGCNVEIAIGHEKDILSAIDICYGNGAVTMEKIIEDMEEEDIKDVQREKWDLEEVEHLKDMAQEAPIINLVNLIITRAVERGASDIHIEPFEDSLHIRHRIDGVLHSTEFPPKGLHAAIVSRIKIMAKLNIAERRLPQDGRIKLKVLGRDIDIRVATIPTLYGEGVVMRLLDSSDIINLDTLGFLPQTRATIHSLIEKPYGMILATGPTGSGKSTTLYAALSKMDSSHKKIITIEDPIEYYLEGISQIQVKPKIGLSFASGLRSIVRQDPDVIMVGEIRDPETADIAIHAALTGHLILSTLHTNDAAGAITRLIDMGIESYLISSSLLGVVAQRLVRITCNKCKALYEPDADAFNRIGIDTAGSGIQICKGEGCETCDYTGYRGRTGIFEFMPIDDDIRHLIVEKKGADVIRQMAIKNGMITLRKDGWEKVRQGITTLEEIIRVTEE